METTDINVSGMLLGSSISLGVIFSRSVRELLQRHIKLREYQSVVLVDGASEHEKPRLVVVRLSFFIT